MDKGNRILTRPPVSRQRPVPVAVTSVSYTPCLPLAVVRYDSETPFHAHEHPMVPSRRKEGRRSQSGRTRCALVWSSDRLGQEKLAYNRGEIAHASSVHAEDMIRRSRTKWQDRVLPSSSGWRFDGCQQDSSCDDMRTHFAYISHCVDPGGIFDCASE